MQYMQRGDLVSGFIWIDSLCIIQKSIEGWQREAPLMNKVYRNAVLTISATASPYGYGGLFRKRSRRGIPSFVRGNAMKKASWEACW